MNYLDAFLIIPLALAAYRGFRKGLIIEIAGLVALILGIYGAFHFSYLTAEKLSPHLNWSAEGIEVAAFVITLIGIIAAVHLIGRLIEKIVKMVALGLLNRMAGLLFGLIKMCIIMSALIMIFEQLDQRYHLVDEQLKEESFVYKPLSMIVPALLPLTEEFGWEIEVVEISL